MVFRYCVLCAYEGSIKDFELLADGNVQALLKTSKVKECYKAQLQKLQNDNLFEQNFVPVIVRELGEEGLLDAKNQR